MAEKKGRMEEDAEEEEELIFPLWEKHMLDLKSQSLALIGIKRMEGRGGGRGGRARGKEMLWLLLMIYCLKWERCSAGCVLFRTFKASGLRQRPLKHFIR